MAKSGRRDATGTVLGLAVFLGGIAILLFTFKLAYDMFTVPPAEALPLTEGQELQVATVGSTVFGMIMRVLLLVVMGVVGSLISNRGVHMYTESRGLTTSETTRVEKKSAKPEPVEEKPKV